MAGTNKQISFFAPPGSGSSGSGLPPGEQIGDVLQWNGIDWIPKLLTELVGSMLNPIAYSIIDNGEIPDVVPPGYKLVGLTLINKGGDLMTVSLGLTDGGNELLDSDIVGSHDWIDRPVDRFLSDTISSSLWFRAQEAMPAEGFTLIVDIKYNYLP